MPYAIEGLEQTLKSLRKFSPELYKEMNAEIKPELKSIVVKAQDKLSSRINGLSNFGVYQNKSGKESHRSFPVYKIEDARKGITYSMGAQKRNMSGWINRYIIWNRSAAGAILETAGRANSQGQPWVGPKGPAGKKYSHSNNPMAGKHFVNATNGFGSLKQIGQGAKNRGRIIFAAVEENQGRAKKAIEQAIIKTCNKFNAGALK